MVTVVVHLKFAKVNATFLEIKLIEVENQTYISTEIDIDT